MHIACSEEAEVHGRHAALPALTPQKALRLAAPQCLGDQLNAADARTGAPHRCRSTGPRTRNATDAPERRRPPHKKTREKHRRRASKYGTMLRGMSPRRKFSFDLAFHRSKEKKRKDSLDDAAFAAMVDETLGASERPARSKSRVARAASFFRSKSRERSDSKDYSSSARASRPSTRDTSARSSWLAMKEAREKEPQKKKMTYAERREAEKRAGKHRERGRRSARGDDAPRIRDLSRDAAARLAQQPPAPVRRAASAQPRRTAPPPAPRRARDDSHRRALRPPADAPSWQQLKARALAADDSAMASYIEREGGFTSVGGPSFTDWFRERFPENDVSSAPAAHKALWTERERQGRLDAAGLTPAEGESRGYLARLRGISAPESPKTFKSGASLRKTSDGRDVHVVTWRVERWSSLPAGFRQGARYRPPGPAPWSLDLYKGGIKKERPGFVSLYVHYAAPSPDSTAKVAALELSLLHQDGGAHLTRRHEGKRVFGAKADLVKKISTSAGTAALAHVVLTQVEALGFVKDDAVVLRAEVEMAPTVRVL